MVESPCALDSFYSPTTPHTIQLWKEASVLQSPPRWAGVHEGIMRNTAAWSPPTSFADALMSFPWC